MWSQLRVTAVTSAMGLMCARPCGMLLYLSGVGIGVCSRVQAHNRPSCHCSLHWWSAALPLPHWWSVALPLPHWRPVSAPSFVLVPADLTLLVVLQDHVLPRIASFSDELRERVMVQGLLPRLLQVAADDPQLPAMLSSIPFVSTRSGKVIAPNQLYDPRCMHRWPKGLWVCDADCLHPGVGVLMLRLMCLCR